MNPLNLCLGLLALCPAVASTSSGQEPPAPPVFPYQRWEAAPGSRVGFAGDSTLHAFSGEATRLTAHLHADLARLAATAGGEVSFLVKDLTTGKADRDENMRGDLEAERFPSITFRLDGLAGEWGPAGATRFDARGAFTIHGVERARNFPVAIERSSAGGLAVRGELTFLQTEHGIEPHSTLGLVRVHDEVRIEWDLRLQPVPTRMLSAAAREIEWRERVLIPGAEPAEETGRGRLWTAETGVLLDVHTPWLMAPAQGQALRLDPRSGRALPPAPSAEDAMREAQERLAGLERRLAELPADQRAKAGPRLEQAIARLRESLAQAPAAGAARIERTGDRVRILLGEVAWVTLEGLAGEEATPSTLAALPELPVEVRRALAEVRGTPRSLECRTCSPAGTRALTLTFGPATPAVVPAWALDPAAWPAVAAAEPQR